LLMFTKKIKTALILTLILLPGFIVGTIDPPTAHGSFADLAEGLVKDFAIPIAIAIAPILFIISGFYYLTAGGNPDNVTKAKNIFIWTVIGLVVVFFAWSVTSLLKDILEIP